MLAVADDTARFRGDKYFAALHLLLNNRHHTHPTLLPSYSTMSSMIPPPKTLVLLFDGTGNFFRKENTNIIRLFEALEHDEPDQQLLYYQPGVGTNGSLMISCR